MVTSIGSDGNTDTHTSGKIRSNYDGQIIELNCGKDQHELVIQIYAQRQSKIKLGIVSESGRGYTMRDYIQPIITVGGINAITTKLGGGVTTISGASVAGAVLAVCCALIFQLAIIDENDTQMYSAKL